MTFEVGDYSFGNSPCLLDGRRVPTAQALRDVLEAVKVADEVGLDSFGVGERHRWAMSLSSPTSMVNAAAAVTHRIKLSTAVTVLSTDAPGPGVPAARHRRLPGCRRHRTGRRTWLVDDHLPLFDHGEHDYDMLYASQLILLMAVNAGENVTWQGPHRRRPLLQPHWPPERRRRAEQALINVVATAHLLGVSTRRVEKLMLPVTARPRRRRRTAPEPSSVRMAGRSQRPTVRPSALTRSVAGPFPLLEAPTREARLPREAASDGGRVRRRSVQRCRVKPP